MSDVKFVQARHYHPGGNLPVVRIVIHDEEHPFDDQSAEGVARMFATTDRQASAHYIADADSVVQCVREADIAFHAPPNSHSIGIERDGYATFTREQWLSDYGQRAGLREAQLVAELCARHGIPPARIGVDAVKAAAAGICGHVDVTNAFHKSTHTDPGKGFPWDEFIACVQDAYRRLTSPALEEDDMLSDEAKAYIDAKFDELKQLLATGNDDNSQPRGSIGAVAARLDQRVGAHGPLLRTIADDVAALKT